MNLNELLGFKPPKNIDELIKDSIKMDAPFQHFSTVMIQDKRGLIKGISQSRRNNLILDHFGEWLALMFRAPVDARNTFIFNDTDLVARTFSFYHSAGAVDDVFCRKEAAGAINIGTTMEIGSGTTAATRADEQIETNFVVAPEDDAFPTGVGAYAVGAIACAGAIVAGGAGTINETLLSGMWCDEGGVAREVALLHDILVAGEAFVLGDTITVTYTLNL